VIGTGSIVTYHHEVWREDPARVLELRPNFGDGRDQAAA
jgi:hypothetical protein